MFFQGILHYCKPVAILLCFLLLATPMMAQTYADDCTQGKADGKADAKASPLWILAGLGLGCIGVGAAFIFPPSVPAEKLIGKSPEYVQCYQKAYKGKAVGKQAGYASIGWVVWILIYVTVIMPSED